MPIVTRGLSEIKERYELKEILGSGSFGVVRRCIHRKTGEELAVKTIAKSKVTNIEVLRREIDILKTVHHPNIIRLVDVYEDFDSIHLVTELCTGGELYDRVLEKSESDEGHFQEDDAAALIHDALDAIAYCHSMNIVHRDLKPENFLLADDNPDKMPPIKIIDFGLSRYADPTFDVMESRVGTPYYVAPEVLQRHYTSKCDVWSIGVIAYILLCGFAPFAGENDYETMYQIENHALDFPSPEWDDISITAKEFIKLLLQKDPKMRPTAQQALQHPWVARFVVKDKDDDDDDDDDGFETLHTLGNGKRNHASLGDLQPDQDVTSVDQTQHTKGVTDSTSKNNSDDDDDGDGDDDKVPPLPQSGSNKPLVLKESDEAPPPMPPRRQMSSRDTSATIRLDSEKTTAFRKFLQNIKIKKALGNLTAGLSPTDITTMGNVFRRIDKDRDGRIALGDIDKAVDRDPNYSGSLRDKLRELRDKLPMRRNEKLDVSALIDAAEASHRETKKKMVAEV